MRQSSNLAVAYASVPRRRIASNVQWIRLRLAVSSAQVFMLRQTLHRAIGNLARVYVVEVDHRHGETTLHVEVEREDREAAMHAIMAALPAAEFGVTTMLGDDHATH
ncbi:Flp pilus assembly protein TadD [Cupriavidus metallidurans]|jgi:hypothetical protein|uniref:DUF4911 domain-containing protein n=1 Tax=Cupriavidus metallidurans (strain ATCC 43123 / DSM 2839 / NBRC 102507 / CH34) TaxID=266264 RepID=Q1LJ42_CUPMC|nr:hypothetical protein [Cupriavidus metallidurans]ABF09834.1 hypothetical protein Rmet_2961 [Cupriavidus metallidurans CH34]KWW34637.1 hypothetical protein AU374_04172 [Cupriavidus metallidurans]MDE4919364.1 hypothetical protein [Cupriavidus metallidurans]QGS29340.1 hypothetical protein FOB83_10825 [Cupriavidus metallidurans]UBM10483.1 hypothetical protein LAI70_24825 [Cupriavidus metallidurans]